MAELFVIVDGNSLMHRAFHALPPMQNKDGIYTNAVYGFLGMLFKVIADRKPQYLAIAFDMHGPTFRHNDFEAYKAGRKPMADELRPQFPLLREALDSMHIVQLESPTFEADDILGTMAKRCEQQGIDALLVTGDRDALQLVTETSHVLFTESGISKTLEYTPQIVLEKHGVTPMQIPDLKGLMGDSSDNIPGVPGVGKVTGTKLIAQYGSVEAALDAADLELKGKLRERMMDGRQVAMLSKRLATITREVPIDQEVTDCTLDRIGEGVPFLEGLELRSLISRLNALTPGNEIKLPTVNAIAFSKPVELTSAADVKAFLSGVEDDEQIAVHWGNNATVACTKGANALIRLSENLLEGMDPTIAASLLQPIFAGTHTVVLYDAKQMIGMLSDWGVAFSAPAEDVLLQAYLLDPQSRKYEAPEHACALLEAYTDRKARIEEQEMTALYRDIEMPLMATLLDMERTGFCVNREALERLGESFSAQLAELKSSIYELTGESGFNILSPKQLSEVLFEKLELPAGRKTKSGYSTDAETLESLLDKHPAIEKILLYRQVSKLNGTYIEGMLPLIDKGGRVHTTFDQTAAATGRISSNEPNLQNIPVRTAMGREIRRAFVAREGWQLVDADYSQIELRLLAHLSGDEQMIDAFLSGEDIHATTAAKVYGVPLSEVTGEMRSAAKAVNFGIVYGISDFGLARNIGVSKREAGEFIERYFDRYPGVKRYMDQAVTDGKAMGYACTLFGRRRPLPELSSSNYNMRSFGERAAMNTPVQGTAADIIKIAMVRVREGLERENLQSKLILQVHDELIVEAPPEEVERVKALVVSCMEGAAQLSVPLSVEAKSAVSWFDAK